MPSYDDCTEMLASFVHSNRNDFLTKEIHTRQKTEGPDTFRQFYARIQQENTHRWVRGKNKNNETWIATDGVETCVAPFYTFAPWFQEPGGSKIGGVAVHLSDHSRAAALPWWRGNVFDHPFFRCQGFVEMG